MRRDVVERLGTARLPEAVGPLLEAVGDESWPVREAALAHLVDFPDSAVHPALEAALRDHADAGLRNAAMEVYVRRGDLEPLVRLVRDEDEEVRNFAAVMIGTLGDAAGAAPLVEALSDPDLNVRHAAAASLGQIGSSEAVPALIRVLEGEPWLQYPAINALSEIGDPRAVPPLLELLGEEMLTAPVLDALGRLAGARGASARRAVSPRRGPGAPQRRDPSGGANRAARDLRRAEPRPRRAGGFEA